MRELTKRILSGLCIGPVVLLLFLFLPARWFLVFLFIVMCLATYELLSISGTRQKLLIGALAVLSIIPLYGSSPRAFIAWLLFSPLVFLVYRMIMSGEESEGVNEEIASRVAVIVVSQIFIVLPLFYFYLLREVNLYLPIILVLTIWASDTGAYFIGKTFGKKRLAPAISPKKTYAGLFGALFGGAVLTLACGRMLDMSIFESVAVGAVIGLLGQLGDIFESIAKRVYSVKDSSGLIPGHGGMLDRIDSFLFTTPFLYHYLVGLSK
ncbi:MAG TPA: phosphatidate cytidylyltransferase [Syntrophorhabdales bacterium]|nr:phosphatidate cytidylyltransferase [Syntrophorhabdales bacterium]